MGGIKPFPMLQKFNNALHYEPYESIVYCVYWSTIFLFWTPIAIIILFIQTVWNMLTWYTFVGRNSSSKGYYCDPENQPDYDMGVVITGCDTGFGKELAIRASSYGYTVFAGCYKYETISKNLFDTIPNIVPFQLDITKDADATNAYELVQKWKQQEQSNVKSTTSAETTTQPKSDIGSKKRVLHAIVNNAGVGLFSETDLSDLSTFQAMMDVNFFGMVRMVKAFLPILKEQAITKTYKGMRIINTVSMAGFVSGAPGLTGYSASKYAAQSFTESLRQELYPFHISVTSVNPSFHATPLITSLDVSSFDKLPQTIQVQYGKTYYNRLIANLTFLFTIFQWEPGVVVEQVIDKCIRSQYPPKQFILGLDAKLFLIGSSKMVPPTIREPIQNLIFYQPKPDCMIK